VTVGTGGTWTSSGAGTFTPNANTLTTTYTLSPAEILLGTVTLTLTTTGNGSCIAATDNMVVNVTPGPTVNANVDQTVCGNNANVTLAGSVTVASGGIWSGGNGTFSPSASTLNATYSPSAAEIIGGVIKLALTTTGNGSCIPAADTMIINITPAPTISAGPDQVVCGNNSNVTLSGSFTQVTGIAWTSTGAGTFNPGNTATNAVYTPSVNEINAGVANLTITTTGFGNCIPISDQMKITITPAPVVNAGPDQTVCANNRVVTLNGSVTVAAGATWTTNGTGTFAPNANTLNATYTPSMGDVGLGSITLSLTSTGNGSCIPVVDQTTITITPMPVVNVLFTTPICADVNSHPLNGNITNATGGVWSTSGTGTFSPNANSLTASYNPSAADKAAGTVGLMLTTTGFGNCIAVSTSRTLRITPAPTVNAGLDKTICADANTVSLSGTRTVATGSTWTSSGTGSFSPNGLTLNTTYIPSASDKSSGTVNITLTTTGNGTCQAVTDNLILRITPAPTVNAGPDQGICADGATANVNGTITIAAGGTWSTLGTGSFLPDNNSLGTSYVPSTADTAAHSVRLVLTTTGNGLCNAVTDTMVVAIRPTPIVRASSGSICADMDGATLDGRVYNASGGQWTTSGSGSFAPNAFTINAHYTPSAADMTNGSAILTLSSTGHGTCNPVTDNMMLIITPLPIANAGTDQIICRNSSTLLLAQTFPDISYEWSTITGANIGNSALISVVATKDTSFVLTVTDSKGCSVHDTVTVLVTDPPIFNLATQHCLNGTGAAIVINSNPSHIPVLGTFQWFRNDTLLLGQNTTIHNSIRPGIHIIQYNAGSCSAYDTTTVRPAPTLDAPDQLFCIGVPNIVRATIIPKATYQWYEIDGVTAIGTDKDTLQTTILADKSFIVTVVDSNSCSNNDTILVQATPVPTLSLIDMPACVGDVVTLNGDPVVIVGTDHSYSWSKNGVVLPVDTFNVLNVTTPGEYTLVYTTGQCVGYDTSNVVFNPLPITSATDTVKFCLELDGAANLDAGPGTSYIWVESGNTSKIETVNEAGKYYVNIFNQFGCVTTDSVYAKDICPPRFHVPTAFMPGNPNYPNDNFLKMFGVYFAKFQMTIFNRWGEVIFYTDDRNVMWDGTYKGEDMPAEVYPYIITYEGEFAEFKGPYRIDGTVTIIR
jgi:gliding motility-associated-like protein